ncbi:NAD(P)-dependent dehydrogenase [Pseudomonas syringae pv. actinidiae]|uniref:NAD(P)-dependent dehydrogenase n=1 Tax=Pseudomonas syringae pv. actinidiae TaxID=103796 RepID=A0A2V0QD72_PSESF|nr:NAD(P)-dependent dehydrogenase [Pseudomonas syringae pv. actinidiae]
MIVRAAQPALKKLADLALLSRRTGKIQRRIGPLTEVDQQARALTVQRKIQLQIWSIERLVGSDSLNDVLPVNIFHDGVQAAEQSHSPCQRSALK